jgi:hypothetical protein
MSRVPAAVASTSTERRLDGCGYRRTQPQMPEHLAWLT